MAEKWENLVIETGVDTLLNYMAEEGKSSVAEISEEIGVSEDRIKKWAKALEEEGFIEKDYSTTKGMILKYTESNKEEAEKRIEELREKIEQKSEEVDSELEKRGKEVKKARESLKEMAEELEENRKKENEVKEQLEELESLEEEIEERLEEQREREENLKSESVTLLSRIDSALERVEEAENKADRFEKEKADLQKKIKALKKLEKHAEKADEVEEKLEEIEAGEEKTLGIFERFKQKIGFIGSSDSKDIDEILSGTVEEAKKEIRSLNDPDYENIIEKEKKGKNRETLLEWLVDQND